MTRFSPASAASVSSPRRTWPTAWPSSPAFWCSSLWVFPSSELLIVYVLSTCIVGVVLVVRFRPRGFKPKGAVIGEILAITAPIGLYLVAGQVLLNLDLWSLKSLWRGTGEVVGHYVASMNLSRMLLVISGAQASVVFASVAWAVAADDTARAQRHIQDATRFAVIIATAAWVILGLNASEVLSLLYSRPYAEWTPFSSPATRRFGALRDSRCSCPGTHGLRPSVVLELVRWPPRYRSPGSAIFFLSPGLVR